MIRCSKCGCFYEELTNGNCPKCGEKAHRSVGRCLICGKEAERGDVCNKCIEEYQSRANKSVEGNKKIVQIDYKKSNCANWLHVISGLIVTATIIGAIALSFVVRDAFFVIAEVVGGLLFAFFLGCYSEHLKYMENTAKQLEEIKEILTRMSR